MARRGVMTALQAALAGIGGAAGGYVQMEETKRKRMVEDEERKQRQAALEAGLQAGIRQEQRDILKGGGTQLAGVGQQVAGPVPSVIPLSGVGNAFAAAEAAGGPATSRGALRQTVGESSFMLPSEGERTARERELTRAFGEEDFQATNRREFETFKAMGGRGEYNPRVIYSRMITDLAAGKALAGQRSLLETRLTTPKPGGAGGAAGSRAERIATLPTVANAAEKLAKMDAKSVAALSGFGVSAASQVPQILTQTRGGFAGMFALPTAAMYGKAAGSKEREYAEMTQAISDAVASMVSVGVLTDKDIDRFKQQVQFYPGDEPKDKIRKFNSMRSWASWLQSGGEGKYPGETDDEYFQRTSMLRAQPGANMQAAQQQGAGATSAPADAQTEEDRRLWDAAVAKHGRAKVEREVGPRP